MLRMIRRFLREDGGFAFVFFLVAMPAFIGLSLLVIDIGRGNNLHFDLQRGVESLALQAAKELDGRDDAIDRAEAVLQNPMAQNRPRFSNEGTAVMALQNANIDYRFLWRIPDSDDDPITGDMITDDPADAAFVWVWAEPQSYTTIFPVSLAMGRGTIQMQTEAVAGYRLEVCDFMPMYICNPYGTLAGLDAALNSTDRRRSLFQLRQAPGNPTNAANGQFGFLNAPTKPGADAIADLLAMDAPPACFSQRGVNLKSGQLGSKATDAINVRFNIYRGSANTYSNKPGFQPATNVRKGFNPPQGNNCPTAPNQQQYDPDKHITLPRDTCFANDNCPLLGGYGGDGVWNCAWYWDKVHAGKPGTNVGPPEGCTPGSIDPPSRYTMYQYELDNGLVNNQSPSGETGRPHSQCYTGGTQPRADRRLVYAAILQCPVASTSNVRPLAFASFFLTEPADYGSGSSIWAELYDVTGWDGPIDQFIREDIVLYR